MKPHLPCSAREGYFAEISAANKNGVKGKRNSYAENVKGILMLKYVSN